MTPLGPVQTTDFDPDSSFQSHHHYAHLYVGMASPNMLGTAINVWKPATYLIRSPTGCETSLVITRPGVAGAVLQTPLLLIHSFIQSVTHPLWKYPKP